MLEVVVEARSGQLFQLTAVVSLQNSTGSQTKTGEGKQLKECRIEITNLDGSDRRVLYDAGQLPSCPHSLAYSARLMRLYWVESIAGEIKSVQVSTSH